MRRSFVILLQWMMGGGTSLLCSPLALCMTIYHTTAGAKIPSERKVISLRIICGRTSAYEEPSTGRLQEAGSFLHIFIGQKKMG
jgi:hypothetical protein